MRPLLGVVLICGLAGLLATASSARLASGEAGGAKRSFAVSIPSAGDLAVAGLVLRAQSKKGKLKRPKLTIVKRSLPKGVSVIAGWRAHPKLKRAWLVSITLLRPKATRTTASAEKHSGLLRFIANGDVQPVRQCSERDSLFGSPSDPFGNCPAFQRGSMFCNDLGAQRLAHGYLALVLGGAPPARTGQAALDLACERQGSSAAMTYLGDILGATPPGPPPLACRGVFRFFDPTEIQGTIQCDQPFGGFDVVFPPGVNVTAFLPQTCNASGGTFGCRDTFQANHPFPINIRTNPNPSRDRVPQIVIFGLDGAQGGTITCTPGPITDTSAFATCP